MRTRNSSVVEDHGVVQQKIDSLYPLRKKSGTDLKGVHKRAPTLRPKDGQYLKPVPTGGLPQQISSPVKKGRAKKDATVEFHDSFELNGETYQVGEDVYIIETSDQMLLPLEDQTDLCCLCNKNHNSKPMVECSRCLGGFHLRCLKPQLKSVPEGDWMCPGCEKGESLPNRKLRTACDMYLWGNDVLGLGRITSIVKNRTGDSKWEFCCQYYVKPEQTHLGRMKHHCAREVFLSTTEHWEEVDCVFWKAVVCKPQDMDKHEGNDIFMCEYVYDQSFKRFVRRSYKQPAGPAVRSGGADGRGVRSEKEGPQAVSSLMEDEEAEWVASSDDDGSDDEDESGDRTFKPIYAFWAEKGMLKGGLPKKYQRNIAASRRRTAANRRNAANRQASGIASTSGQRDKGSLQGKASSILLGGNDVEELAEGLLNGQGAVSLPVRGAGGPLAAARRCLLLSNTPSELPCRDMEKTRVTKFVENIIDKDAESSGVMYICGIPGTGKTACVMEVLGGLRQQAVDAGVQLVTINALSLPSPQHVYSKLWERLAGQRCGASKALSQLESMFASRSSQKGPQAMTLLLVDEIDILMTKDQSVLYNLFEWPTLPGARLAVIGISNTHDLDSRVLPRIASRLASSKLAFQPYNASQLQTIIRSRLMGSVVFKDLVIEHAARKVASTSGDVRRAMELLRRAVDAAEEDLAKQRAVGQPEPSSYQGIVTREHMLKAINEIYGSVHMQYLRSCSLSEKVLMVALMIEMRSTKKAHSTVQALHQRLDTHVALLLKEARMHENCVLSLATGLAAKGLLSCMPSWRHIHMKVQFKVEVSDVETALKEDVRLVPLHNQMTV
ncbi:hypothetical protein CEUSTIGMA_g7430.t1 [Chlamydomonas eustigma]|uniref:Origin recognition complex subunit 1 n=1 Tax=Chlamydomonas eustigma TaxID=1157962 RepID=A0A250XB47_9CHLO|nr:hypothetical protein CEUSTIGMA_g7430.t1 [Chlamydomonas eustigma]|eukprot:GAX79990.1 hypothetical protein CEUSTIGMA_g7430.t1 [Chlamydomonas eustigma]